MHLRRLILPWAAACLAAVPTLYAATPSPLDAVRFSFPGSVLTPTSAISAGFALADRFVADDATWNPAAKIVTGLSASPQFVRVSRQDLSAANRDFDQQFANFDFAGGSLAFPIKRMDVTLYAWQPALRVENVSYTVGTDQTLGAPASITTDATLRELRSGIALGFGRGSTRFGLAGEWTHRDDSYQVKETSGSPDAGLRTAAFNGNALGGGAGLRWEHHPEQAHGLVIGAAAHVVGSLDATGSSVAKLTSGDSTLAFTVTRDAVWQAGIGARYTLTPLSGVYAALGARGPEKWDEFAVESATGSDWRLGIDYHDPELPWAVRAGVGQEVQPGTPEPRAGSVGVGLTWYSGDTLFDFGLLHRSIERPGQPVSSDDRFVGSVRVHFGGGEK